MTHNQPSGENIVEAYAQIQKVCTLTELRDLDWVSKIIGKKVIGKFENQQRTGSFKFRGAYYRIKYRNTTKPVIAASAGNHGLAVAEAANILQVKATIVIPTTASALKKERLSSYGHSIIQQGASLDEAILYAQELAKEFDWDFLSPYNDPLLITGQGTVAVEFLTQCRDIDMIIVPTGGGGLLTGIGLVAKHINPKIKVVGVCPETHPSFFQSFKKKQIIQVSNYPTFADGLAVNLEDGNITLPLSQKVVDEVVLVSEEQIAAATLALLFHESQLVEPSGAVGLAALMGNIIKLDSRNKIGILFTGSNVSTGNLHKILNYPFSNSKLFDFINVHGVKTKYQNTLRGADFSISINKTNNLIKEDFLDKDQKSDEEQDRHYWSGRYEHIQLLVLKLGKISKEYREYCNLEKINLDNFALKNLEDSLERIKKILDDPESTIISSNLSPSDYNRNITEHVQRYRALLHELLSASLVLDWRSASYGQSWDTMFFHVDSQGNPGVNYNRYESNQLAEVEKTLANILGVNLEQLALLATSSGMSAYSLIESYLLREVLEPGAKIYIPHYIYFETEEQISSLSHIQIIRTDTHEPDEIINNVLTEKPKVLFLDPLTNTVDLRMTDIELILKRIAQNVSETLYVVIDGTMLSGQVDVSKLTKISQKIIILYYDSCSKYLQLGLDVAMGGLIVVPVETQASFNRLRRNTGAIMYDATANIFPVYDRQTHQARMVRFSRNARIIGELIEADPELKGKLVPHFPGLTSHQDNHIAMKYASVGGVITFSFTDPSLNQRDSLNSFIEVALKATKEYNVSLTKGVSFGFSLPRISAASAMAENSPPFLRLSTGDRSYAETVLLGQALIAAFKFYISNSVRFVE